MQAPKISSLIAKGSRRFSLNCIKAPFSKGYIIVISPKNSFQVIIQLKEYSRQPKREELFKRLTEIDLAGSTNEVQDPKLILNSMFITKQQFDEQVEIFKGVIS
jgi:hypothetical protein